MTRTPKRALVRSLVVAGAMATAGAWARPARADLWGGDLPLLSGILAEAIAEVGNLSSMVTQIVEEVRLMKTMLSGLNPRSFTELTAFLHSAQITAAALTGGVRSMSYSLEQIDRQFQVLFPSDTRAATFAQHAAYYSSWNDEVLAAAQIASRQQTVIERLGAGAGEVGDLVRQSENASGELGQLQLIVRMLSILHTQLVTINQTLATTGRVLTDMGAASASSNQLSQTKKQDSLSNYTSRGDPVRVPARLP